MFILNKEENGIVNLAQVKEIKTEKIIGQYYIMADGIKLTDCYDKEEAEKIIWDIFKAIKEKKDTYFFIY